MIEHLNILKDLNPQYFWDVDINGLDIRRSRRLIIERIFVMGTSEEINLIIRYYGAREVVDVLKNLNYLYPKTLNFVSKLFKISSKSFKCYTRKQLNHQHWNS
jgi:hypothetical protein